MNPFALIVALFVAMISAYLIGRIVYNPALRWAKKIIPITEGTDEDRNNFAFFASAFAFLISFLLILGFQLWIYFKAEELWKMSSTF